MDIKIGWDNVVGHGEYNFINGDIETTQGIEDLINAVTISLFSDRRCPDDIVPWDGNKRGWWADQYLPEPLGSDLWLLERARKSGNTQLLLQARDYSQAALQWLIDDGIAEDVEVCTWWLQADAIGIQVTISQPQQSETFNLSYSWSWK